MLEVGRIDRPHGIRGEVLVTLYTPQVERLSAGSVLATDRGDLTVQRSRPHRNRYLVSFAGISDRDGAEDWQGVTLLAESVEDPDSEVLWVHEVVGLRLFDQYDYDRGQITGVIDNPASDLLELENGALVPAAFIVEHHPRDRIVVSAPKGLFDDMHEPEANDAH